MQANAIPGPWPAGERVLVAIDDGPAVLPSCATPPHVGAPACAWTVLHVETPRSLRLSEADRDRIAETLRGAERLGADTIVIPGRRAADEILAFASANNATHLIIAKPRRRRWRIWPGGVGAELMERSGPISIHAVGVGDDKAPVPASSTRRGWRGTPRLSGERSDRRRRHRLGMVLRQYFDVRNVALVFLVGVLTAAMSFGLWPALFACLASVLAFNFFFLPPLYTFTITDPESVVALVFFTIVALIASNLAARVRNQAVVARQRAKTTEDLYQFSRKLAAVGTLDDVLWATAFQIASMLRCASSCSCRRTAHRRQGRLSARGQAGGGGRRRGEMGLREQPAGRTRRRHAAGRASPLSADEDGARRRRGRRRRHRWRGTAAQPEQRRLFDALADQAALAIERVHLVEDVDASSAMPRPIGCARRC